MLRTVTTDTREAHLVFPASSSGARTLSALPGVLFHGLLPATTPGRTTGPGSRREVDA
ncbi:MULTISPECIES: hypothetical protein [unclassified Streptomyces]|uniref:hypothetical protein n=1 Tax=unclassified Streptomyces TaxID=2593676 RepID=UPI001E3BB318|nr:hypothetical protein [Streptomyces sp. CB02980]MCB8907922.1 hypothetical protein [Streptomyces sp. CB02980]